MEVCITFGIMRKVLGPEYDDVWNLFLCIYMYNIWTVCIIFCFQILYKMGVEGGVLPYIKYGDVLVYSLSTAFVLHAVSMKNHSLILPSTIKLCLKATMV